MRRYPVVLTKDDNGTLLATCPDLPEVAGIGNTVAEALQSAREVIGLAIADRLENREHVPGPSKSRYMVDIGLNLALRVKLLELLKLPSLLKPAKRPAISRAAGKSGS